MYQIYCDGQLIYDPRIASLAVASADLDLQINKTGTFTFELYPDHPYYALPKILESAVTLEKDGETFKLNLTQIVKISQAIDFD